MSGKHIACFYFKKTLIFHWMRDSDYFDQIVLMFSSCLMFVDTGNVEESSDVVTAVSDANVDILEGILINLSLVGNKLFMGHIIVQGEMFSNMV